LKRGDLIWLVCFAATGMALALPGPHEMLRELSLSHRYRVGFLAFAVMGVLGQAMSARFTDGEYPSPGVLALSCFLWGLCGLALGLLIWLVNGGVVMLQAVGMLPGGGLSYDSNLFVAILSSVYFTQPLFTSIFLNLGALHPLWAVLSLGREAADTCLAEKRLPGLNQVACRVDWAAFIRREVQAIPMFRIPALTIVFMLPQDLWLVTTAFAVALLAVLEGLILRSPNRPEPEETKN